jgi:hypothetical protein
MMQADQLAARSTMRRRMTLSQYVLRRNGVPLGARRSFRNMVYRSFGAESFAVFWKYWNPIWGYYLGRYVYSPIKKVVPTSLAVIGTFVVSGAIQDVVISAVTGSIYVLFTPWFLLLGIGSQIPINVARRSWWHRATVNLSYVVVCFIGAQLLL